MKMTGFPMSTTDWAEIVPSEHPGDTGMALWRTQNFGDIRVRIVQYSPGYSADHWCSKGHVLLCLEGELALSPAYLRCELAFNLDDYGPNSTSLIRS